MRKLVIAAALTIGTAGLAALPSAAQAGGGAWLVGIHADNVQVKVGDTIHFTGKVRPAGAAAGHKVELQEKFRADKPWKTKDTSKVNSSGHYVLTETPTVNTVRKYRVLMPATPHHAKGISPTIEVKVYGWSALFDHTYVNPNNMYPTSSVNLNGTTYDKSILATWTGQTSVEFNLNHKCLALRGTFGISDNSETGAQSTVNAEADGTQFYTHTFDLGETDFQKFQLDSPLKLKLSAESMVSGVDGYGAIGSPDVYCVQ
jgi:hypothetical protein